MVMDFNLTRNPKPPVPLSQIADAGWFYLEPTGNELYVKAYKNDSDIDFYCLRLNDGSKYELAPDTPCYAVVSATISTQE